MAKNYVQDGETIEFTATKDITSGEAVEVSSVVVVAINNVKSGDKGLGYASGVWELPKAAGTTFNQGVSVYLKDGEIGTDNTGSYVGKAWRAGVNGETLAAVKLSPSAA